MGGILARVAKDTVKIVHDDSIEIWVDPTPGAEHGKAFQLLANSVGRMAYDCHVRGRTKQVAQWDGKWVVKHAVADGWWTVEAALPVAGMAPGRTADQGVWGVNVCRNWKQPWKFSSISPSGYKPHDTRFAFGGAAPLATWHIHHTDPTTRDVDTELRRAQLRRQARTSEGVAGVGP